METRASLIKSGCHGGRFLTDADMNIKVQDVLFVS